MTPLVEIKEISKTFGSTTALADINLDIAQGQFFALVGPSGSGKTTLLHILGGFVRPSSGQIRIAAQDVSDLPPARRPTTSMFQDYALFPHMSVGSNVGFGLLMRKIPKSERRTRVAQALKMVGLAGMASRRVHQLSGGQQQRVALARALVVEPKVLLLDEPLGALDLNLRRQMQQELLDIQKQVGTTFVHVTHDQEEAMSIADVMAVMNGGRIEDVGPPQRVYMKPRTRFTATFMGESNIIEGKVTDRSGNQVEVETAMGRFRIDGDAALGAAVDVSIRPEQISAGDGDSRYQIGFGEVSVTEVSFFGTHHRCRTRHATSGQSLVIRLPQHQPARPGDKLSISVSREDIVLLLD